MTNKNPHHRLHLHRRVRFSVVATGTALVVWLLHFTQPIELLDGCLYDVCLRTRSSFDDKETSVLLVATREFARGHLFSILDELDKLGARHVGIVVPNGLSPSALGWPATDPWQCPVTLGECNAGASVGARTPSACNDLLCAPTGVLRHHYTRLATSAGFKESLAGQLARRCLLAPNKLPPGTFRVAFRGGPRSLPHVCAEDVLSGSLVEELVADRIVLIGALSGADDIGLVTPTTRPGETMSSLEYHGHALNTLLRRRAIRDSRAGWHFFLILFVAVIGRCLANAADFKWTVAAMMAFAAMGGGVALATLCWFDLWLPCGSLATTLAVAGVHALFHRLTVTTRDLGALQLQQQTLLRRRRLAWRVESPEQAIQLGAELFYQLFFFDRSVLFYLPEGKNHLVVAQAINCHVEDIKELRRDVRRLPYSEAFATGRPLRVSADRSFLFRAPRDDETQYVVPVQLAGRILAAIAVAVKEKTISGQPNFEDQMQAVADEIAILMSRCEQTTCSPTNSWLRALFVPGEASALAQLGAAQNLIDRRTVLVETFVDQAATPSAIYDVFGHMQIMNQRMFRIMQDRGVVPAETTAVELLVSLTDFEPLKCRKLLRRVVLDRRQTMATVVDPETSERYLLYIRPISIASRLANSIADSSPFEISGIHLELINSSALTSYQTSFQEASRCKEEAIRRTLDDAQQAITRLVMNIDPNGDIDPNRDPAKLAIQVQRSIGRAQTNLSELKSLTQSRDDLSLVVPVDGLAILEQAINEIQDALQPRGLSADVSLPDRLEPVGALPLYLKSAFDDMLGLLCRHADNNTSICIRVEDQIKDVAFVFENESYADDDDQDNEVEETNLDADSAIEELRDVGVCVDQWNGRVSVKQRIGQGISATMILQKYDWPTPATDRAGGVDATNWSEPSHG